MDTIIVFNQEEERFTGTIKAMLESRVSSEDIVTLTNQENALHDLAAAISRYPSILGQQHLSGASRSVETLVEELCQKDAIDIKLHIPTKAILGQGFAIAKINFFLMLKYLCSNYRDLIHNAHDINEIIANNIFAVMAEEVFFTLIADHAVSRHIRINASYLLANLWERRIDFGISEFPPIITGIWAARTILKPAFGTMLGISELMVLSENAGPAWTEFLQREELDQNELDSIREFLLGISFEEIEHLSAEKERRGVPSLSREEMYDLLGDDTAYPEYRADDPRELYRSFRHRKKNAIFRARAGSRGPTKTIEEYLMCYLLSRAE
ncbi:MAG: hypothetical protein A2176_11755 [Spirochaetes bacterium RBG_13_51_14]|nr:MAG: hypothetical protein A2176_11755 [Spirochaetes bacterium RBG_13_51_14]